MPLLSPFSFQRIVLAPMVTGSEPFEAMYRVQMNTLELLVAFLPALFMASRSLGFMVSFAPIIVLLLGALAGALGLVG